MSNEAALRRARGLLMRPEAWIDQGAAPYPLRLSPDRRGRVILRLEESLLVDLVADPGLRPRPGGGWTARPPASSIPDRAARPGRIEGERTLVLPDGAVVRRRANLGENPLAWLASRRGPDGAPYITVAERAAGERLRQDAERASAGLSLTLRWDALPRSGGGSAARAEIGDAAMAAARRVRLALSILPPAERAMVDAICISGSSLQAAEGGLGLRRRQGRQTLRRGLAALAGHYGVTAANTAAHRPPGDR